MSFIELLDDIKKEELEYYYQTFKDSLTNLVKMDPTLIYYQVPLPQQKNITIIGSDYSFDFRLRDYIKNRLANEGLVADSILFQPFYLSVTWK
ncbi:MAG TPA: hypothetical protein VLG50_07460 [Candidatus Saccharimonadales bacterium]|nr:hypothetical protein [Candidatus Saccharimonadales bacterium]